IESKRIRTIRTRNAVIAKPSRFVSFRFARNPTSSWIWICLQHHATRLLLGPPSQERPLCAAHLRLALDAIFYAWSATTVKMIVTLLPWPHYSSLLLFSFFSFFFFFFSFCL